MIKTPRTAESVVFLCKSVYDGFMSKFIRIVGVLFIVAGIAAGAFFYRQFSGIGPALLPPPSDIVDLIEPTKPESPKPGQNATDFPLTLPYGLDVTIFAKDLPSARVLKFARNGDLYVSQLAEGQVTRLDVENGVVIRQTAMFTGLNNPHGLAFDPQDPETLYIAEEDKLSSVDLAMTNELIKILDLDTGGLHVSRTINFGPDGRLYLSSGSSCNVCDEESTQRAKIHTVDIVAGTLTDFARGLRNSVFFTWHPNTGEMWATDMGRDFLGDDLPPDEINIVKEGSNYGWPICYGQNIHDTDFDKNVYIRNPCMEPFETGSFVDLPAHAAPLGLAFIPKSWPEEYHDDLLVAVHGSWNRSEPTGYKIIRIKLDAKGAYEGMEDFVSGWLTDDGALGRPVDVVFGPDDALYVSDDKAGVIYRMSIN